MKNSILKKPTSPKPMGFSFSQEHIEVNKNIWQEVWCGLSLGEFEGFISTCWLLPQKYFHAVTHIHTLQEISLNFLPGWVNYSFFAQTKVSIELWVISREYITLPAPYRGRSGKTLHSKASRNSAPTSKLGAHFTYKDPANPNINTFLTVQVCYNSRFSSASTSLHPCTSEWSCVWILSLSLSPSLSLTSPLLFLLNRFLPSILLNSYFTRDVSTFQLFYSNLFFFVDIS